jgi:hypothetical protein
MPASDARNGWIIAGIVVAISLVLLLVTVLTR